MILNKTIDEVNGQYHTLSHPSFPFQGIPLIGRERELQEVIALLERSNIRLLTLTGTGGVGKTRLATHLATTALSRFPPDSLFLVSLAALRDPAQVLPTLLQSLGIVGANETNGIERLTSFFIAQPRLLILDNFEHLLGASPLLVSLLEACPLLTILVTSRTALRLSFEYEYPLPPLALPNLSALPEHEVLTQYGAVALLLQRAQQTQPDFRLTPENSSAIAEICVRLDGLPLAIELAAARLKLFSPHQLLARLTQRLSLLSSRARDISPRHHTLRANLDWSYQLLSAREQRLLRWLAVFVGGCTFQAIEEVVATSGEEGLLLLEDLTSLIENSLLSTASQPGQEQRFFLLETIREYAWERLEQSSETAVAQQAHANACLRWIEQVAPALEGPEQPGWVARIAQDYSNLRAGLIWFLEYEEEQQGHEKALRLAIALATFWMTGPLSEGCAFLEQALSRSAQLQSRVRARALMELGSLLSYQGNSDQAEAALRESLALARRLDFLQSIVGSLNLLGYLAMLRGAYSEASALLQESLILARQEGKVSDIGFALDLLSNVLIFQGEYKQAIPLAEESLWWYQQTGNRQKVADAQGSLGLLAFYRGELSAATSWYEACLAAQEEVGDRIATAQILRNLSMIAVFQEDFTRARLLLDRGLRLRQEDGRPYSASEWHTLGRVAFGEGDVTEALACYHQSLASFQQQENPFQLAFCLEGLAEVLAARQPFQAACLLGCAKSLWQSIQAERPPVLQARSAATLITLREHLDTQTLYEASQQGWQIDRAGLSLFVEQHNEFAQSSSSQHTATMTQEREAPEADALSPFPEALTEREREVFRLLAEGLTKPQIAERLILSFHTVNAHVRSIYAKVGVSSRSAATRYALEHHLA